MAILSLVLIVGLIFILYHYIKTWMRLRELSKHGVRTSIGIPLFYRFLDVFKTLGDKNKSPYDAWGEMMWENNCSLFAFKRSMFTPIMIKSGRPEVNKYILENVDNYNKGSFLTTSLVPLLGDGIFIANGKHWLDQRKNASFMFAKREVKKMVDIFVDHFAEFKKHLKEGQVIEMQDLYSRLTLDAFCDLAFGINVNSLDTSKESGFSQAFNVAQHESLIRFVWYPFWKYLPSFLFPFEKRLNEAVDHLNKMLYSLIDERKRDADIEARTDLLSRYIVLQKEQKEKGVNKDDLEITDVYIRDICLNFILAGRDTTAQTLLWSTYLLSLPENREVFERVKQEASFEGELSYSNLQSLPYIEHFIYETLRLYPPVPTDPKSVVNEDVLPGGIRVYPGEIIIWTQNYMGRSTEFFSDPLKCNPDRWISKEHNGGIEPKLWSGGFIPFQNGGRRVCMGQEMALLEVKAVICALMRSGISFEVAPNQNIMRYPNITICAKEGIKLVPHFSNTDIKN